MKEGEYRRIVISGTGVYKEKNSKFTGRDFYCKDEKSAKAILDTLWKENPAACHICYAWRFGTDKFSDRFSDDGEPNNSAGKPIFGQILSYQLTNVLVAVVRIYGGTNLGVGGLMQAYKAAADEALKNSSIETTSVRNYYNLDFDHSKTGLVEKILDNVSAVVDNRRYSGSIASITFGVPIHNVDKALDAFEAARLNEMIFLKTE
jgi:uncharacterized YigZ family protein